MPTGATKISRKSFPCPATDTPFPLLLHAPHLTPLLTWTLCCQWSGCCYWFFTLTPFSPAPAFYWLLGSPFTKWKHCGGEKKWILKCTSPITSLIHFYDSVLFNDLLNNLPPWDTSTHFPGAAKVLPKGFKCRLAWTVDVSILALGMLGRNEDTHPRAAESGGLGNTREEF